MRSLILLTTEFPFGKKEPFLENELSIIADSFDRVIIYALYAKGDARNIVFPPNVEFYKVIRRRKSLYPFIRLLFSISFYKEFLRLIILRKHIIGRLYHLIKFSYYTFQSFSFIKKDLSKLNIKSGGSDLYFYSYWLVEHAYIALKLKKVFKGKIAFSRAHGYDLYEYRDPYKYIPYRKLLTNGLDYIFPISFNGKDVLKKYGGKTTIKVSHLGTKDYGIGPLLEEGPFLLVSCSWCTAVKRINLIIEALSIINNISIKWVHFGDGHLLNYLKEIADKELKSNIKYHFKGSISNQDLMHFYETNHVDLFINVSSSEGIPVSIMEALSFGIPVIATNVGGVPEIIQDSKNGILLDVNCSAGEIADAIIKYINLDKPSITQLSQNARSFWIKNYSADTNYNIFYSILLGKND